MKLALANLSYPHSRADALARVVAAVHDAGKAGARIVCFPEAYLPGYRGLGHVPPPPDQAFLERAWREVEAAAKQASVAVVLGTERVVEGRPVITALVVDATGKRLGFQDKVQLDPSEDDLYRPAASTARTVFEIDGLRFGVVICHEGFRYPETVRTLARQGAQVVFHPHYAPASPGSFRPTSFADPRNTFHEASMLCRAAENTVFYASVNYASAGSGTTSAVARPSGALLAHQPYGLEGLLVVEVELSEATGLLASRLRGV